MTFRLLVTAALLLLLSGCEIPGLGPDPRILQREADAKAIGSSCRYSLRSIEDCFILNEGASKSAVFDGWKAMDEYMRENSIEGIRSTLGAAAPKEEVIESDEAPSPPASTAADKKDSSASKATGKTAAH